MSWYDKYEAVLYIETQPEADAHFERCVEHNMRISGKSRAEAEKVERANIGYWGGWCNTYEQRERLEALFATEHPFFGKLTVKGWPTAEEAFNMGKEMAKKMATEKPV